MKRIGMLGRIRRITGRLRRARTTTGGVGGALIAVAILAVAGCGSDKPASTAKPKPAGTASASASGSAGASVSGSPSVNPSDLIEFTVDGAGPYQLGATLAALQAKGSLDQVSAGGDGCPDNTTAHGTGVWKDVQLSFHKDGKLYVLINRSPSVPTPSGAWLGTPLAQLKTIYVGVQGQDLTQGANSAFLVATLSGRGILFELNPSKQVSSMVAGDANFLSTTYRGGGKYC
jgi:hypothetical protein